MEKVFPVHERFTRSWWHPEDVFLAQDLVPVPTPTPVPLVSDGVIGGLVLVVLLIVGGMVSFGLFTGWLAAQRGRQWGLWFLLGLVSGPVALLAVGFAPDLGTHRRDVIVGPAPPSGAQPQAAPPPPPRAAASEPITPMRLDVDVDAVVFHEPSGQSFGRGLVEDGSMIYFTISRDELRDLSERLRTTRPVQSFVHPRDVVERDALPRELRG